jgi:hypothetical protein
VNRAFHEFITSSDNKHAIDVDRHANKALTRILELPLAWTQVLEASLLQKFEKSK